MNNSMKPVRFNLEFAFRCDFADLFEVKAGNIVRRGRITTEWSENRSQLRTMEITTRLHGATIPVGPISRLVAALC